MTTKPLTAPTPTENPNAFDLPASALRFERAGLTLAKPEGQAEPGKPAAVPFSMRARTGQPIVHWYWGQIIHDMAGFTARKPVIAVDYCHDQREVLGFGDKQTPSDEGLDISGKLTPFEPNDRASEVVHKSTEGVPYEASIQFDYSSVEFLQQNATATVNGQEIAGPAYIVRQWTLVGVAICIYGADGNTSTNFSDNQETRSVTLFSKSGAPLMTTNVTETGTVPDATKPTTPTELTADQVKANLTAGLKKFTSKFGTENGANWFTDGKSYEEALELHIDAQGETIKKLTADLEAANTKLANAPKGETTPVSTSDAEKPAKSLGKKPVEDSNIAKFAAVNKLPGAK